MEIKKEPLDYDESEDRIKKIVKQEFEREIDEREDEIMQMETKIQYLKRYIHFIKYSASKRLYQKEKIEEGEIEPSIHPCVKKFLKNQCEIPEDVKEVEETIEEEFKYEENVEKKIENVTVVRGTYRVRHQIVIGNISKWQGSREDGATHKWMVYVRDKNDENLSKYVKKIRYFLHESYKPHDIIDVTSWPFHLTRRGWGEFPIRVTIFFKHGANKPVDFVHELKLDHTCSGVDQLGGETVFELDLIHENLNFPPNINESPQKIQNLFLIDHDYCKIENNGQIIKNDVLLKQLSSQALSIGAETSEICALKNWTLDKGPINQWYHDDVIKRVSAITFFSAEACVKWFLKRWPIVTPNARIAQYRNVHAYCFATFDEFFATHEIKRFAAEWYRSNKIKQMLECLNLNVWSTKQILMYARMHGYVAVLSKQFFLPANLNAISTFTSDIDTENDLRQLHIVDNVKIDVIGNSEPLDKIVTFVPKQIKFLSNWAKIVEIFSKEIGIKLYNEPISDSYESNISSVLLGHVLKIFLDDLLRKSLCNAWLRNKCKNPGSLEVQDIVKSIIDSPEFDILTNIGLGSKNAE